MTDYSGYITGALRSYCLEEGLPLPVVNGFSREDAWKAYYQVSNASRMKDMSFYSGSSNQSWNPSLGRVNYSSSQSNGGVDPLAASYRMLFGGGDTSSTGGPWSYHNFWDVGKVKDDPKHFHMEPTVYDDGSIMFHDTTGHLGDLKYMRRGHGFAVDGTLESLQASVGRGGYNLGLDRLRDRDWFNG
ncbi:MAG: hypothetical protein ABIA21_04010 [Candidatus Aenigmatarchaeota archaeon]